MYRRARITAAEADRIHDLFWPEDSERLEALSARQRGQLRRAAETFYGGSYGPGDEVGLLDAFEASGVWER